MSSGEKERPAWFKKIALFIICLFATAGIGVYVADFFIPRFLGDSFIQEHKILAGVIRGIFMITMALLLEIYLKILVDDRLKKVLNEWLKNIIGEKFAPLTPDKLEKAKNAFMCSLSSALCKELMEPVRSSLRDVHQELLLRLAKDTKNDSFYAYHTIVNHATQMRELVRKIVELPRSPHVMKVLIEDYSKKALHNQFLVDFPTFLEFAKILVKNSTQMRFVNTTSPYEWWCPIQFESTSEIATAIEQYRNAIRSEMTKGAKVTRITIVDNEKALTSVLEDGIRKYLQKRGIDIHSIQTDENKSFRQDQVKPVVLWIQTLLAKYQSELTQAVPQQIAAKVLKIITNEHTDDGQKFANLRNAEGIWDSNQRDFHQPFKQLSQEISLIVLKKFLDLHKPEDSAYYIIKNKVIGETKVTIDDLMKEEGMFIDNNTGSQYLLRQEVVDGVNLLLVTIQVLDDPGGSANFERLKKDFVDETSQNAAGLLTNLINLLDTQMRNSATNV